MQNSPYVDLPIFTVTVPGVSKLLAELDQTKSTGPDELSPRILKESRSEISEVLCFIFNQSLTTGEIPDDWRMANVCPIYKKGPKCNPENYRPISLTSICCKTL